MSSVGDRLSARDRKALNELADKLLGLESSVKDLQNRPGLAFSSIDDGALVATDDGEVSMVIGKQSDGSFTSKSVKGPKPSTVPTAPVLTPDSGAADVVWDGQAVGGGIQADVTAVRIEVAREEGSWSTAGHFQTVEAGQVSITLGGGTWRVRLLFVTESHMVSDPSAVVTVEIEPRVNVADIQAVLDDAQDRIDAAQAVADQKFADMDERADDFQEAIDFAQDKVTAIENLLDSMPDPLTMEEAVQQAQTAIDSLGDITGRLEAAEADLADKVSSSRVDDIEGELSTALTGPVDHDRLRAGVGAFDEGFVGELWAGNIRALAAELARAIVAAPNRIPWFGHPDFRDFWGTGGLNTSHPSVWVRGRANRDSNKAIYLEAGEYRFSVDAQSSVPGTVYTLQLRESGTSTGPYITPQITISGSGWESASNDFTLAESGDYDLRIWGSHPNGATNDDGYQWFRNMRLVSRVDGSLLVENSVTADSVYVTTELITKILGVETAVADILVANTGLWAQAITAINAELQNLSVTEKANFVDAFADTFWANDFVARVATMGRAIIAAQNLLPTFDSDIHRDFYRTANVGFNSTYKSVWIQGRNTVTHPGKVWLEEGLEYRFDVAVAGSVTGTRYYIDLVQADAVSEYRRVASSVLAGTNSTTFAPYTFTFTVQRSAEYRLKIWANHTNGTANPDGHQWFQGLAIRNKLDGKLVVTGSIDTPQLNVTEQMTAALLAAKKVVAGELDVNQIWSDSSWIDSMSGSEARLEARDGSTVNVVNGQGMRVFTETSDAGDRTLFQAGIHGDQQIASYDAEGRVMYQIDEAGAGSFIDLSTENDPTVGGRPLMGTLVDHAPPTDDGTVMGWMPRGIIAWGEREIPNTSWQYKEYGFLEVAAQLYADRTYKLTVPHFGQWSSNGTNTVRIRATTSGTSPTVMSSQLALFAAGASTVNDVLSIGGAFIFTPPADAHYRLLLTITNPDRVRTPGSGFARARLIVEDIGAALPDSGVARTSLAYPASGGSGEEHDAPPSVRTYTTEWDATWFQSYRNNGAQRLNSGTGNQFPIQGYTSYWAAGGRQTSLIGFGGASRSNIAGETGKTMQAATSGAKILSIHVEMRAEHFHASTGGQLRMHRSNAASAPSSYADTPANHMTTQTFRRGQRKRIGLAPGTYGPLLQNGSFRAIGLAPRGSTSSLYYGYASWGAQRPKIIVTYER